MQVLLNYCSENLKYSMNYLPANIKFLRKKNGWTQKQLAEILGVTNSQISMYESGDNEPKLDAFFKLTELFGVNSDDLRNKDLTKEDLPASAKGDPVKRLEARLDKLEARLLENETPELLEELKRMKRDLIRKYPDVAKELGIE